MPVRIRFRIRITDTGLLQCDESRPSCNNCKRRSVECVYGKIYHSPSANSGSVVSTSADSTAVSSTGTKEDDLHDSTSRVTDQGSNINSLHLELLHNFTTSTCFTFTRDPVLQTLWRVNVPQVGLTQPFAMQMILAMSAYHIAHFRPSQKAFYVSNADILHDEAIRTVSTILPSITDENCTGLWLFAVMTSIVACARPRKPGDFVFFGERGIPAWLQLVRGTSSIMSQAEDRLLSGPLGPIISLGRTRTLLRESAPRSNQDHLTELRKTIAISVSDPATLNTYDFAIDELIKSFAVITQLGPQNVESADVFVWLFSVSEDYLHLLNKKTPEALVIFGFFSVMFKHLEWQWWMQGWANHLLAGVYYALDSVHKLWLQWPIEQLGWMPP
jgi:hypothetical protein